MRVLVVDDEPLARDELGYLLSEHEGVEVVGEAGDGETALRLVRERKPDVVFMDIDLGGDNGIDLARRYLREPQPPRVVFATAYDQHALEAFAVKALDYIVKPFTEERVAETVQHLKEMLQAPPPVPPPPGPRRDGRHTEASAVPGPARRLDRLAVEANERIILLAPESVIYATREERSTLIKADSGSYRTTLSLQELEERLSEHPFFRPHRAYLVNVERIAEINPWFNGAYELVMKDKELSRIPVSRASAKRLRELLRF